MPNGDLTHFFGHIQIHSIDLLFCQPFEMFKQKLPDMQVGEWGQIFILDINPHFPVILPHGPPVTHPV